MSYKITRGRVPTGRSKDSHKTASRPADPNQPPNQSKGGAKPRPDGAQKTRPALQRLPADELPHD